MAVLIESRLVARRAGPVRVGEPLCMRMVGITRVHMQERSLRKRHQQAGDQAKVYRPPLHYSHRTVRFGQDNTAQGTPSKNSADPYEKGIWTRDDSIRRFGPLKRLSDCARTVWERWSTPRWPIAAPGVWAMPGRCSIKPSVSLHTTLRLRIRLQIIFPY